MQWTYENFADYLILNIALKDFARIQMYVLLVKTQRCIFDGVYRDDNSRYIGTLEGVMEIQGEFAIDHNDYAILRE